MPQPVVHFEVIGRDPTRLRKYFGELFDWEFDVPSAVSKEVSEPADYGFLDLVTSEDGTGIRGGVGGGVGYASHAVFYVGVPNVEAALQRAEKLGGHVVGTLPTNSQQARREVLGCQPPGTRSVATTGALSAPSVAAVQEGEPLAGSLAHADVASRLWRLRGYGFVKSLP